MVEIDFDGMNLVVAAQLTPLNLPILREIPMNAIFSQKLNAFVCPPTQRNVSYLRAAFSDAAWTDAAEQEADTVAGPDPRKNAVSLLEQLHIEVDVSAASDYTFGTEPFPHQLEIFCLARGKTAFGYLMDPRTGKTKPIIDEASWAYLKRGLRRMLVVCPKNAKTEWEDQIPFHGPPGVKHSVFVYHARFGAKAKIDLQNWCRRDEPAELQWLIINVQATIRPNILKALIAYVARFKCGVVYDESTTIKSPSSQSTHCAYKIGKPAIFRRIMTGTAPPNGPVDLYSQFKFLNPNIIGCRNVREFIETYTQPVPWSKHKRIPKNADQLASLIATHSYRKRYNDVARYLPEEQRITLRVNMTPVQEQIYKDLREDMIAEYEGREVTVKDLLTMGMRLMQITGGFVRWRDIEDGGLPEPIPGVNPKLEAVMELLERYTEQKIVIWAAFRTEIQMLHRAIAKEYGEESVGMFYGGTPDVERERVRREFQDPDSPLRFFVGNAQAGGMAIPLWRSNTCIYFSNSFNYLYREQSEFRIKIDRPEKTNLGYYDIVVPGTWDERCLRALAQKKDVAATLQGDKLRDSLRAAL